MVFIASWRYVTACFNSDNYWGVGSRKSSKSNLQIAKKIKKKCRYAKILIDIELPDYKKMWGGRSKVKVDLIVIHGVNVYVLHFVNVEGYVYGHEATKYGGVFTNLKLNL